MSESELRILNRIYLPFSFKRRLKIGMQKSSFKRLGN